MTSIKSLHSVGRAIAVWACLLLAHPDAFAHEAGREAQPWVVRQISFRAADGTRISGSLVTARTGHALAAVVLGPGSTPGERYENLAALLALRGITTLTYDKRGAGRSEGARGHTGDLAAANLARYAEDAAAAMRWVAGNADLQSLPRGFVALSQSGWVIPLALQQSPKIDFMGFWSGPTCTTSEQARFQQLSESHGGDRAGMSEPEIREAMHEVRPRADDVDPVESLRGVSTPGLWLFGSADPWVPIELSVSRLQALIDSGRSNFSYQVFPEQGHNLADSPEQASFSAMVDWIRLQAASRPK